MSIKFSENQVGLIIYLHYVIVTTISVTNAVLSSLLSRFPFVYGDVRLHMYVWIVHLVSLSMVRMEESDWLKC